MLAYSGGVRSGYAVLLMMAMIWFGLQASDRELLVALVVLAVCAFVPMLVLGPPAYPVSWGHAALLVVIGSTVAASLRYAVRESQRLNRRLRRLALVDELTRLLNRRGWTEESSRVLERAGRDGTPVSLLMLDLDGLKAINDELGHEEGDRLLAGTGDRLRRAVRAGDVAARLRGDEFAVLLPGMPIAAAAAAAARLDQDTPATARFSSGASEWNGRESLERLMRRADLALYAAKAGGAETSEWR